MKAVAQIDSEIDMLSIEAGRVPTDHKEGRRLYSRLTKRIEYLRSIKMYLLTNPDEMYLRGEVRRINRLESSARQRYDNWKLSQKDPLRENKTKLRQIEKEMDLSKLRRFKKNILFILS